MNVTAEMVAAKASRILGQPITAQMVREIENARCQLKAMNSQRAVAEQRAASGLGDVIRCMCGCGKTFTRAHSRAKFHPDCRRRAYADRGLMALCKPRTPEVVRP